MPLHSVVFVTQSVVIVRSSSVQQKINMATSAVYNCPLSQTHEAAELGRSGNLPRGNLCLKPSQFAVTASISSCAIFPFDLLIKVDVRVCFSIRGRYFRAITQVIEFPYIYFLSKGNRILRCILYTLEGGFTYAISMY